MDEFKNLKYVYEKLREKMNMNIYLKFFRSFCRQPEDIEIKHQKKHKQRFIKNEDSDPDSEEGGENEVFPPGDGPTMAETA